MSDLRMFFRGARVGRSSEPTHHETSHYKGGGWDYAPSCSCGWISQRRYSTAGGFRAWAENMARFDWEAHAYK